MSEAAEDKAPEEKPAPSAARHTASQPAPEAAPEEAPAEPLMGLRDFLAVAPRYPSDSVTKAAHKAMERWMRMQSHDVNGFYTMAQWQEHYQNAMAYTG
jgi:hypothetical protein